MTEAAMETQIFKTETIVHFSYSLFVSLISMCRFLFFCFLEGARGRRVVDSSQLQFLNKTIEFIFAGINMFWARLRLILFFYYHNFGGH